MTRRRTSTALEVSRAVVMFVGLCAVIAGVLAMHIWMGGHGATSHHLTAGESSITASIAGHGHHAEASPSAIAETGHAGKGVPVGCGSGCGDEMAAGMCVLALLIIGVLRLPGRRNRPVPGRRLLAAWTFVRRPTGPPGTGPSLTQLCISRT